ncbi:MAG: hypothetical protein PHN88_04585 [Ignavibacteria bacterium]|nr:hypothetical protein [Ignavibacteria bacterium]
MRYILALLVCFIFVSCSKEEKRNESISSKDSISLIQASKEKSLQDSIKKMQEKIAALEKVKDDDKIKETQDVQSSKPSDSQLQKDFKNKVPVKFFGNAKALGFTKTNGIENDRGIGSFTAMFDGEIEATKDDLQFGMSSGGTYKVKGNIYYKKSEKGWIVSDFDCNIKR